MTAAATPEFFAAPVPPGHLTSLPEPICDFQVGLTSDRYVVNPSVVPDESERWITVMGNFRDCGIADFEAGNPVFGEQGRLRAWVQGRANMGARARVYCDRSNVPLVQQELAGLSWLWWIATLDGNKLSPSYLPGMWGVQYTGNNRYDTSVLYGEW